MPEENESTVVLGTQPDAVATPVSTPSPVLTGGPGPDWHQGLYQRVVNAVYALPSLFRSSLNIAGIRATDLYTLNTALGAAIEQSVVDNLNALRSIWDPDRNLQAYAFVRQPQAFPDVRLQTAAPAIEPQILLGIELKGWFALSKEGEPSFRYLVTPAACADADLLVVFPWILDELISGSPRLLKPFLTEARYAAEYRNHYWMIARGVEGRAAEINTAQYQLRYPAKRDRCNDSAVVDSGSNFGRVARSGIMEAFIAEMMLQPLAGIPLAAWQRFIKLFSDGYQHDAVLARLQVIATEYAGPLDSSSDAQAAFANFSASLARLISTLQ